MRGTVTAHVMRPAPATRGRLAVLDESRLVAEALARSLTRRGIAAIAITDGDEVVPLPVAAALVSADGSRVQVSRRVGWLRASAPDAALLLLVRGDHPDPRGTAKRLRAAGWVHRQADLDEVVAAIEAVVGGRRPRAASLPAITPAATPDPTGILTDRESDVLGRMVYGDTNDVIAEKLCISRHTVRTHVQSIFAKLGVRSRLAAIAVGRASGLGLGMPDGRAS